VLARYNSRKTKPLIFGGFSFFMLRQGCFCWITSENRRQQSFAGFGKVCRQHFHSEVGSARRFGNVRMVGIPDISTRNFRDAGQPSRTLLDYADLSLPIEALLSTKSELD